jgi:pimeloyl-ACP methyl ester carboxylesterase
VGGPGAAQLLGKGIPVTAASTPEGPGSVSGAPNLPAGFADTFTSRFVDTGELRLHAVTAVDQRGIGLSDKPAGGYDTATLAREATRVASS